MKIFFKLNLLILLTSAFLGFSSCANGSSGGGGGGGSGFTPSSGSLMMRLPSPSGRAVYQMSDANYYDVTLISKDSSSIQKKSGIPGATIEFMNLSPQTYTVHVYAYSSDTKETIVAESDDVDASVVAGKKSDVRVTMHPNVKIEPPSSPSGSGSSGGQPSGGQPSGENPAGGQPAGGSPNDSPDQSPFEGFQEVSDWAALCQLVNDYSNKDKQLCVLLKSGGEMTQILTVQGNVLIQTDTNVTLTRPTTLKDSLIKVTTGASLKLGGDDGGMLTIDGNKSNATATSSMIVVESGSLEIANNCTLQNAKLSAGSNDNYKNGAAIYIVGTSNTRANLTLSGGFITGNECNKNGGAIYIGTCTTATLSGNEITGNTSTISTKSNSTGGGAIYITCGTTDSTTLTMTGGKITENTCENSYGGGVFVNAGTFNFNGGEISGNTVPDGTNGAQVYKGGTATFKINGTEQTNSLE